MKKDTRTLARIRLNLAESYELICNRKRVGTVSNMTSSQTVGTCECEAVRKRLKNHKIHLTCDAYSFNGPRPLQVPSQLTV